MNLVLMASGWDHINDPSSKPIVHNSKESHGLTEVEIDLRCRFYISNPLHYVFIHHSQIKTRTSSEQANWNHHFPAVAVLPWHQTWSRKEPRSSVTQRKTSQLFLLLLQPQPFNRGQTKFQTRGGANAWNSKCHAIIKKLDEKHGVEDLRHTTGWHNSFAFTI